MPDDHRSRWLLALLAFALLTGLALRFYRFPLPGSQANAATPLITLPPGLDSDEAFHTLAAWRLLQDGRPVPFFKIDQGIPAAMIYFIALVFQWTGPVAEGGRIVSLAFGTVMLFVLPVAAAWFFPNALAVGVFTAAQIAFTFWFVNFSRIGLEQMTCAWFITLAFITFWNWYQRPGYLPAIASGLALALAVYTYPAAYFLPPALALVGLYLMSVSQPRWRPRWREVAAQWAAFICGSAPLMVFFIQNPEWVVRRSTQVGSSTLMHAPLDFARTLGALIWRGDEITRHNLNGQALLDPLQFAFFCIGLVYALRQWRKPAFGLTLIWFGVMLLPATLSVNPEHFGRLVGSLPAIMLLGGLGGGLSWAWLAKRPVGVRWLGQIGLTLAVLASAVNTAHAYFVRWPQVPGFLGTFDFPERLQAEAINRSPMADAYISPSDRERSMFAFLWQDRPQAQSFDGRQCTVAPEIAANDTLWLVNVLPFEDPQTAARLAKLYPTLQTEMLFVDHGTPAVAQFSVPEGAVAQVPPGRLGSFADFVELVEARTQAKPSKGETLKLQLTWRVTATTSADWTVAIHLLDANKALRAQDDRRPCNHSFLTPVWQPGQIIVEDREIALPADLTPGLYTLAIAFYQLADGQRAPVFDIYQQAAGDLLLVQEFTLP